MRDPCRIVKETLELAGRSIKPGMTTKDLDAILHEYIVSCGAYPSCLNYYGYPAATCISIDDMVVHGIPSDKIIIKEGQLVSVDLCLLRRIPRRRSENVLRRGSYPRKEKTRRRHQRMLFRSRQGSWRRRSARRYRLRRSASRRRKRILGSERNGRTRYRQRNARRS